MGDHSARKTDQRKQRRLSVVQDMKPAAEEDPSSDLQVPQELLDDIPEELRADFVQFFSHIQISRHFSGPLPPPSIFNQYDNDARQVILAESVEYRRHRTKTEERSQIVFFVRDILALLAAFVLALLLIVGSMDIIRQGQSIEGLLGIGATVSLVAGAFLIRDRQRQKERDTPGNL